MKKRDLKRAKKVEIEKMSESEAISLLSEDGESTIDLTIKETGIQSREGDISIKSELACSSDCMIIQTEDLVVNGKSLTNNLHRKDEHSIVFNNLEDSAKQPSENAKLDQSDSISRNNEVNESDSGDSDSSDFEEGTSEWTEHDSCDYNPIYAENKTDSHSESYENIKDPEPKIKTLKPWRSDSSTNNCCICNESILKKDKFIITSYSCNHKAHTEWMRKKLIKHNMKIASRPLQWLAKGCTKRVCQANVRNGIQDAEIVAKYQTHLSIFNFIYNAKYSQKMYCFTCQKKIKNSKRFKKCTRKEHNYIDLIKLRKNLKRTESKNYKERCKQFKWMFDQQVAEHLHRSNISLAN